MFVGSIAAHGIATLLAVALGDLISTYVSELWLELAEPTLSLCMTRCCLVMRVACSSLVKEKTLTYIGGGLFLLFAATSTVNVVGALG